MAFEAVIQRSKTKMFKSSARAAAVLPIRNGSPPTLLQLCPTLPNSPRLSPDAPPTLSNSRPTPVLACYITHECQVACLRLSSRLSTDSLRPFSPSVRFSACMAFLLMDFGLPCESMVFEHFDKLLAFPFRALEGSGVCGSQSSQSSRVEN